MRNVLNFVIAVVIGTAAATGATYVMDNMFTIPYGKEWLAYVMLSIAIGIGIAVSTIINSKMYNHKRGE